MLCIYYFDTNTLLQLQESIFNDPKFCVSSITFQELENIKTSAHKSDDIKFKARNILRLLSKNDDYTICICTKRSYDYLEEAEWPITNDNLIIAGAALLKKDGNDITFITSDAACGVIARCHGLDVASAHPNPECEYTGYKEVVMDDDNLSEFYMNLHENKYGSLLNEYLIIRNNNGEVIDRRRWNGEMYDVLRYKQISNDYTGKIKPRNPQQELCFDMLQDQNTPVKLITGKFGTGKDFLMLSHALQSVIKTCRFDKIIWVRNNIEVKDSRQIGFLPGSQNDKLMPFAQIIADHVGGQEGLEVLISQGQIELCHLGFLRGRDIKNSIIYCSEAENLTKQHVQLLMGRVGEGSQLWMNGDFKQVDSFAFEQNSGLLTAIDKLKGHKNFGFVKLEKSERSEVAAMADLLD